MEKGEKKFLIDNSKILEKECLLLSFASDAEATKNRKTNKKLNILRLIAIVIGGSLCVIFYPFHIASFGAALVFLTTMSFTVYAEETWYKNVSSKSFNLANKIRKYRNILQSVEDLKYDIWKPCY